MSISTLELRQIFEILMNYVEEYNVKNFSPEQDYYVTVYPDHLDKFLKCCDKNYTLGSIYDDIEFLRKLLTGEHEMPTTVDVEKFGAVITALGQEMLK